MTSSETLALSNRSRVVLVLLTLLVCVVALAGCGGNTNIDSRYGRRRGASGGASVNGTAVLSGMFDEAGHRVTSWRRLSPRLEEFDVLVWAPDDFAPPNEETREYLEEWLSNGSERTLVYIGRDFDATADYWQKIQPTAPPEQQMEVSRRLAEARADHASRRAAMKDGDYARWFVTRRGQGARRAKQLESPDSDWLEGVDASKVDIFLDSRLDPPEEADVPKNRLADLPEIDVLLASNGDAIVTRVTDPSWSDGKVLVVANGSFLLNVPLVNHEHRKLAGKLVDECGPPAEVAFLESDANGLPIYDQEPDASYPTGAEVFTVWPLGVIALHLVALGILFCFCEFPIFGRPKTRSEVVVPVGFGGVVTSFLGVVVATDPRTSEEAARGRSDFGLHIRALGGLLQRTGDVSYAQARLQHYHQHVKRESTAALQATPPTTNDPQTAIKSTTV